MTETEDNFILPFAEKVARRLWIPSVCFHEDRMSKSSWVSMLKTAERKQRWGIWNIFLKEEVEEEGEQKHNLCKYCQSFLFASKNYKYARRKEDQEIWYFTDHLWAGSSFLSTASPYCSSKDTVLIRNLVSATA